MRKRSETTEYCNGEIRECGICRCGGERYGDKCACKRNVQNLYNDKITCIAKGSNDTCSNRGSCTCGTCSCLDGYEGKYCECNKDSCPRDTKNNLCSGHGKCVCGVCNCDRGWDKEDCHCPLSTEACQSSNDIICNNRGTCNCGQCKCRDIPEWYKRYDGQDDYCNLSPNPQYHMLQCRYLEDCAISFWNQRPCEDDKIITSWIDELTDVYTNSTEWNLCPEIKVDVGCYSSYVYKYNDDVYDIDVLVLKHKDCTKNYLIYGITCLAIIVFIGIATIVGWKLLTDAQDKRDT
ncbi:integrin beta-like protein 1 [Manduca sexta]|uniref:integrin beta-like protein 1 n=1 Tax=Manduca sexta TaxID=7130 RepID=UPI00188F55DD|nr:integrin beta-like protein 1 [Manduca sexta]